MHRFSICCFFFIVAYQTLRIFFTFYFQMPKITIEFLERITHLFRIVNLNEIKSDQIILSNC